MDRRRRAGLLETGRESLEVITDLLGSPGATNREVMASLDSVVDFLEAVEPLRVLLAEAGVERGAIREAQALAAQWPEMIEVEREELLTVLDAVRSVVQHLSELHESDV